MSRNSNQLSVAELLARNGQQPTAGGGGRRRRGGRGLSVSDLSGDIPVVDGGSSHAAADDDEESAGSHAGYAPYSAQDYADEPGSGGEPSQSPMSGPITVYNPLAPDSGAAEPDGAPPRLGEPDPYPGGEPPRRGRRRRAEPDDDEPDPYAGIDPAAANQPWEAGPPPPSGGRAARRRAAEAAESAVEDPPPPPPEIPAGYDLPPAGYGLPPAVAGFGPAPAPSTEFGHPDTGPWPGAESGPPRLGPPVPPTEVWQAPAPTDDPRPKLERRRRGARPLPDPAPRPEPPQPADQAAAADQATAVWSLAEQNQRPGPPDPIGPLLDKADLGRLRGNRADRPGAPAPVPPGFPEPGPPPPDFGADGGFRNTDMFATDVYGPMRPVPGPMPRKHGPDTGEYDPDPDSDFYAVGADEIDDEPRKGRNRLSRTGKFGAASAKFSGAGAKFGGASGKLAAARSRLAAGGRESGTADAEDPRKQWVVLGVQSVGAALAGMLLFKGFELLWGVQPLAALALAVVVILGLVGLVRILRRTDDMFSTVIAVVVGVFVTLGPLAFLLSTG